MPVIKYEIRAGAYFDSVLLMHLQRALAGLDGIIDAGVVMATPANLDLMLQSELLPSQAETANPEDLLIVLRAQDEHHAESALAMVDELIASRRSETHSEFRPKSLEAAMRMSPDAGFVLISVPGRYAAGVAKDALRGRRHVFLYSDNVPIEEELELKQIGKEEGLLVMGPDCGTSIVNGIGLGFANRVRRGGIGLVGAAGTGLQAVSSRIHTIGEGVSHAIGTGGRDLQSEIGGITALQAIDLFARDPMTKVIVLVSKPPHPEVATRLLMACQNCGKQVVVNFMGYGAPAPKMGNLYFTANFNETAEVAVRLLRERENSQVENEAHTGSYPPGRKYVRGLFSGGSLANEALRALQSIYTPVYSNIATDDASQLTDPVRTQANTILDLGEDEFTVGRLHPMMDNDLRLRLLEQEASDPEVAVILMDLVLGEGAHPDPASEFAPAIDRARTVHQVEVVVVVIGTDQDPQGLEEQRQQLSDAGARIFDNVSDAVTSISRRMVFREVEEYKRVKLDSLTATVQAINVGLETFYESLTEQGVETVQVDWKPPAGGNEQLMSILKKMRE
jgi:FdrA protein